MSSLRISQRPSSPQASTSAESLVGSGSKPEDPTQVQPSVTGFPGHPHLDGAPTVPILPLGLIPSNADPGARTPTPTYVRRPGPDALHRIADLLGLDEQQKTAFSADLRKFLQEYKTIDPTALPPLAQPHVSLGNIVKGTVAGGAAGYGTSFLFANFIGKYVGIAHPPTGALTILSAGILHALFSEAVAGAIRTSWGTPAPVDARIWSNYVTAHAMLTGAIVARNPKEQKKWEEVLKQVNAAAEAQGAQVHSIFKNHPLLGSFARSYMSEDVPFFWFTALYFITGATQPYTRLALGGKELTDKALLATVDGLIAMAGGFVAGIGTAASSNLLREKYQDAPRRPGQHDPAVRISIAEREKAARQILDSRLKELGQMSETLTEHLAQNPGDVEAQQVLKRIQKTTEYVSSQTAHSLARSKSLVTQIGRQNRTAGRTIVMNLGRADKSPESWHTQESIRVRFFSKVMANTVSLIPAAMHILSMGEVLNHIMPLGGFDPPGANATDMGWNNNTAWGNSTVAGMEPQIGEALQWTTTLGMSLIVGWNTRSFLSPLFEHLTEVVLHADQGIRSYFGNAADHADASEELHSVAIRNAAPRSSDESVESVESVESDEDANDNQGAVSSSSSAEPGEDSKGKGRVGERSAAVSSSSSSTDVEPSLGKPGGRPEGNEETGSSGSSTDVEPSLGKPGGRPEGDEETVSSGSWAEVEPPLGEPVESPKSSQDMGSSSSSAEVEPSFVKPAESPKGTRDAGSSGSPANAEPPLGKPVESPKSNQGTGSSSSSAEGAPSSASADSSDSDDGLKSSKSE